MKIEQGAAWALILFMVFAAADRVFGQAPTNLQIMGTTAVAPGWDEKCAVAEVCHRFVDQASVDEVWNPSSWAGTIPAAWDPAVNGGKLTIEPFITHNTAGVFWFDFPAMTQDVWIQYRVRLSSSFVNNPDPSGSKVGILFHQASCSGNEIAHMARGAFANGTGAPGGSLHASYYESCGADGYHVRDPMGVGNGNEYDYQPGGDTACHRHTPHPTLPCWFFPGDEWVTFTTHVDLINRVSRGWVQVDGQEQLQIMEFPTQSMTQASSMFLGPYMNGRDGTVPYPMMYFWFQDFIASRVPLL